MDGLDDYYFRLRQKYPVQLTERVSNGFKHSFSPNPRDATFIIQTNQPSQQQHQNQQYLPEQPQNFYQVQRPHTKTRQQYQQPFPNPTSPQQYHQASAQPQNHVKQPPHQQYLPQQETDNQDGDFLKVPNNSILGEFPTMKIKRDNVFRSPDITDKSLPPVEEVTYSIKPGRSSISNNLGSTNNQT
jgi:hypothetical protein